MGGIIASALATPYLKLARGWEFASSDSSPTIAVLACCIFVLFAAAFHDYREGKFASLLSSCTWGIYIFHPLFLNLAIKVLHFYPLHYNPLLSIPLSCVGIFAVSAAFAYLLKHIPIVRRWF